MAYKHLTLEDRVKIEKLLEVDLPYRDIADIIGVHVATIYREIERGTIDGEYNAMRAHIHYQTLLKLSRKKKKH